MDDIYKKISDPYECGIENNEKSEIQEFYANQNVFLTGCTGFLGKCIVEKLLRSCPDLKKLYLMVRPKKVSAKERIQKYFNDTLFEKLHELRPNFLSKVVVIEGNLEKKNLGLSDEDKNIIINEATIFFHNASNVKFELRISESLNCNVFGTKNMLDLATECKQLRVFVYVSTAYAHCHQKQLFEKSYPPPGDLKLIQDCIDADLATPNGMSETAIREFIAPWLNMYVFGKATAENLVKEYAEKVPFRCTIFRPSIVISSYQEPIPGWTDNVNGPVLAFLGVGLGIIHIAYNSRDPFDMVPVDMCVNGMLATTWDAVLNRQESGSVLVYNYGSSVTNPISLMDFGTSVVINGKKHPTEKMVGPYFVFWPKNIVLFFLGHILFHCIPALFADIALLLSGRKPQALSILFKLSMWLPLINFFSNGNWRIYVNETSSVWDKMNKRDNELFYNDLRTLKWDIFTFSYWPGLRKYVLKDPLTTLAKGRKLFSLYRVILQVFCVIMASLFIYFYWEYLLLIFLPFHDAAKLLCPYRKL